MIRHPLFWADLTAFWLHMISRPESRPHTRKGGMPWRSGR